MDVIEKEGFVRTVMLEENVQIQRMLYLCVYDAICKQKKLDRYGNKKGGYFELKIANDQMKLVSDKISDIVYNKYNSLY